MAAPLAGIRVLEMAGLAPGPYCGLILADFGASVIKVDRAQPTGEIPLNRLNRGKRSIALDVQKAASRGILLKLCRNSDVFIDPYRPGVMERLGFGPKELLSENPRLIYARLSGFGQTGPWNKMAGHDINYIAISGLLSLLGRKGEKPYPPLNLVADFAGGALTCAFGILLALFERTRSGKGQVVDASMVEGAAYVGGFAFQTQALPQLWHGERGENLLDTGFPVYDTYETKDGRFLAVGALERKFHTELLQKMGLKEFSESEMILSAPTVREALTACFKTKTRDEWMTIFDGSDACVTPVLELAEVGEHPQNKARRSFVSYSEGGTTYWEPQPAPRLSRTAAAPDFANIPTPGRDTEEILRDIGCSAAEIDQLQSDGVVGAPEKAKL